MNKEKYKVICRFDGDAEAGEVFADVIAKKLSRLMESGRVVPFMRKDNASENGKNMVESKDIKDYNGCTAIDQSRAPGLAG